MTDAMTKCRYCGREFQPTHDHRGEIVAERLSDHLITCPARSRIREDRRRADLERLRR